MKKRICTPIVCPECLGKSTVNSDVIGLIKPIDIVPNDIYTCLGCGAVFALRHEFGRSEYEEADGILELDA